MAAKQKFKQGLELWGVELRSNNGGVVTLANSLGIFVHANTADRTYTFPDQTGNIALVSDVNKTGFPNRTSTTLTWNTGTRTITLAPTGSNFTVSVNGTKYVKTTQTSTIPAVTGGYFIYFDNTGTLQQSTTPWDILTTAPIAYVYYDSGLADGFAFEERHGDIMDPSTHYYLHNVNGTEALSGFAITGYDLAGAGGNATNAFNTFAIATGKVADEDIIFDTSALADGGPYTIFNRTGATGTWTWTKANTIPFKVGTTFPQYNQWTGATWQLTEGASLRYINYFVYGTTSLDPLFQFIIIPGQNIFTSLAGAQAETYANLSLGTLPFQEIVPLYQITLRTGTGVAYNGATGSCRIEAVTRITGSKTSISQASITNHEGLSGLLGGDGIDGHYHLTLAKYTEANQYASISLSGHLSSTDWNTFNGKQAALNGTGFVKATGTTISYDNTSYQPLDADLTAIGALAGTTGVLKKTAADTWALDTALVVNYCNYVDDGVLNYAYPVIWGINGNQYRTTATYLTWNPSLKTFGVKGVLSIQGSTSGAVTFSTPAVAGSVSLTLPTITGTLALIADVNARQAAYTNLTTIGALANAAGVLYNNGTGTFSYIAAGGSGTVTSVSTAAANQGLTATWSMASPTPALTLGFTDLQLPSESFGLRSNYGTFCETYFERACVIGSNIYRDPVDTVSQVKTRNSHATYGHAMLWMSGGQILVYAKSESVTAGTVVTKNLLATFADAGISFTKAVTVNSNINATGYSTSWGATNGVSTGGINVVQGTGASATWLISGTSGGTVRGGLQLLDSGGAMRIYANTHYIDINSSGINHDGTYLAATNQTMYIGTTAVAINRGSGALSLAGVSIDGSSTSLVNGAISLIAGSAWKAWISRSNAADSGIALHDSANAALGYAYADGSTVGMLNASAGWCFGFTKSTGAMVYGSIPGTFVTGTVPIASTVKTSFASGGNFAYTNVAGYFVTGTTTGTIKIAIPNAAQGIMVSFKIVGYDYSNKNEWELHIGGYIYSGDANGWHPPARSVRGFNCPFTSVRFAKDPSGYPCILLGIMSTSWSYPAITITEAVSGYSAQDQFTGTTITLLANETSYVASAAYDPNSITTVSSVTAMAFYGNGQSIINGATIMPLSLRTSSAGPWCLELYRTDLTAGSKVYNDTGSRWYFEHLPNFAGATPITSSSIGSQSVTYSTTVGVNYSNDSNSTYQMLWGSGNYVYGTAGIYCNPSTDILYAADFSASSDIRLKENIVPFTNALEKIKKLQIVTFNWNELSGRYSDTRHIGFIAQNVQEFIPQAVQDDGDYLSVSYVKMVPVLAQGINELQLKVEALEAEVKMLKERLAS